MKMENELGAPRAGRVAELRCAEGAAVEAGQTWSSSLELQLSTGRPGD